MIGSGPADNIHLTAVERNCQPGLLTCGYAGWAPEGGGKRRLTRATPDLAHLILQSS